MDTVKTLRELWRLRLLVGGVCVVALLAGLAILYQPSFPPKSRQYDVGVATTSILLDTPNSQVVAVAPRGSDTLGLRANLLASLMVDGVVKTAIARAAGLNPNDLVGVSTSVTDQPVNRPKDPRAPVLTTQVVTDNRSNPLPIIVITAQAGNAAAAGRLANAAVVGLREYLDSTAATEGISAAQRLQVSGLSVPQGQTATRGPSNILAFLAVILVFVLGCACILGVRALMRGWNAASVRERLGDDELLAPEIAPTPDEPFGEEIPHAPPPVLRTGSARSWSTGEIIPAPSVAIIGRVQIDPIQAETAGLGERLHDGQDALVRNFASKPVLNTDTQGFV
jgi:hypothetical protein